MLFSGTAARTHQCVRCHRSIEHLDIPQSTCLLQVLMSGTAFLFGSFLSVLCMTLPKASRTAWVVKFSEGIRLMKCFCRLFSYCPRHQRTFSRSLCRSSVWRTFCRISYTAGSASSKFAASSYEFVSRYPKILTPRGTHLMLAFRAH